ncbi:winged helix-turn-helix transcriptional regulator [Heliobacterium gestii]|uniref:Winged helix-turn-helix transcriptional regulator n=1 Tax=Heliomicrobium gestii TaxID=2699 RepID=A0A845LM13_HELGE|nr:Lrp/AsnC family transcriptional regulator [Heliomicrobium gestii]MBM7868056.1 Lrp/AsnC family leucine-responsive transcriptional regulator [Heliomicrobium gestii]MZP44413.1 winged helix-turn-helix transcriptional regulator [Heliomicrobium gestii]
MYDAVDCRILQHLQRNGRVTQTELASLVGLSSPAVAERIKKLEEKGVIQGFQARLNPKALDLGLTAFISLRLDHPNSYQRFVEQIVECPYILECHRVTGEDGFLLKIRVKDTLELEQILTTQILSLPGVSHTRTSIALATPKEETVLPLPTEEQSA